MPALMSLSLSLKFVIFAAAIFVSNIVQALTGFAGVMLSIPPSMLLFGPDMAIAVINALCWGVSVVLAWRNRRYLNLKGVLTIVGFMLAGMAIGVKLYSLVSPQIIGPIRRNHCSRCTEKPARKAFRKAYEPLAVRSYPHRRRNHPWYVCFRRRPACSLSGGYLPQ